MARTPCADIVPAPPAFQPRAAAAALGRALRTAPVAVLLGARQTGKTTLLRKVAGPSCH